MQLPIRYCLFIITILAILSLSGGTAKAQASSYGELQAAYLYNFAKYIRWPEEQETFDIGVIGSDDDIFNLLTTVLKDKRIGGKTLTIKEITSKDTLSSFQIIYIPGSSSKHMASTVAAVENEDILIVTERDLIAKGAHISFLIYGNKLRFKLSKEALSKTGLIASEGLLKLAILE